LFRTSPIGERSSIRAGVSPSFSEFTKGRRIAFQFMNFGQRVGMLKIHRTANGEVILKVSGRMGAENVADVKLSLESEVDGRRILLDLRDLTLVDRDAVSFLADCETDRVQIISCPAYIREWIVRERAAR
jgi:hypothetical protein